jgi:hypothetical protein
MKRAERTLERREEMTELNEQLVNTQSGTIKRGEEARGMKKEKTHLHKGSKQKQWEWSIIIIIIG